MAQQPAPPTETLSQFRVQQMRAWMGTIWWRGAMVLVPLLVGAVAVVALPDYNPVLVFVLAAVAAALAGAVGTYWLADRLAKASFTQSWSRSRGWTTGMGTWLDEATPLLRSGQRQGSKDHVCKTLGDGRRVALCHYTYEVMNQTTDSDGKPDTYWDKYEFTVIQTAVTDAGIARLGLYPSGVDVDAEVSSSRLVRLESSELERDYRLEVADSASDVTVRLLFEPTFIVWCVDRAADKMLVEVEDGTLIVAIPKHSYDAAQLDGLVDKATAIATRFRDIAAETPAAETPKEAKT